VKTVAGLAPNPGDVDGIGSAARFNEPFGLAVDSAGNIYVPEIYGHVIRKVAPSGADWVVTTVAGTAGNPGFADGAGLQARFRGPSGVAVDPAGNVYVADEINHTIRKVSATGEVTTLAGAAGYGGSNNGTGTAAGFRAPTGVASDGAGNVYVADAANNTIRRITPAGAVTTLAGLADNEGDEDGTGSAARFKYPNGLTVDSAGNVYVADSFNHTIRKVTAAGVVTTLAGQSGAGGSADGTGSNASFNTPTSVAVDGQNNVYVADTWNHTVRKVTPARVVTTLAGLAGVSGSTDGAGAAARFSSPTGLAVDGAGNVYVADTYNNKIRKVTPAGVVTTLAGSEGTIGTTDATGSATRFGNPAGIAVDSTGNLYVADFYFNTIRKGSPALMIHNSGFTNGQFGFHLTGPVGQTVVIEASADLLNWLPVWTGTFPGALDFIDPQSGYSHRVYRARLP
jgi:sugar lactone lactonase YvrE